MQDTNKIMRKPLLPPDLGRAFLLGLFQTTGFLCFSSWALVEGAVGKSMTQVPRAHKILLHENLEATAWHCPATGLQLAVDFHERGAPPAHDVVLELESLAA